MSSFLAQQRSTYFAKARTESRRGRIRRLCVEPLEGRQLLARGFGELPANDSYPGQMVQHFSPSELGVVDSYTNGASILDGDQDFYQFVAAVSGEIVVTLRHQGGNPQGDDTDADKDDLRLERMQDATTVIGGPVTVVGNGASASLTVTASAGQSFVFRVRGNDGNDDANYQIEIQNRDREDDAGTNNNTLPVATNLGTFGSFAPGVLDNYTITSPDRDYFTFAVPANTPGDLTASVIMPAGSGAASGSDGPTNLGLRIRDAAGTVIASSNGTITAVDSATITVPNSASPTTYYLEVYSGSLGQVNRYDLSIGANPIPTGTFSGFKFDDLNSDGLWDENEPGLSGVTINLDLDNNSSIDVTATTNESGFYQFNAVPLGTHRLTESIPAGSQQTLPGVAGNFQYIISVNPLDLFLDHLDFGDFTPGMISGQKFNDLNGDGIKNGADSGLQNWTIFIDADNSGTLTSGDPQTLTDSSGNYSFTNLASGTYQVLELAQLGWVQTSTNPAPITVISHTNATGVDFGNFQRISISGQKFNDRDGNGVKDGGEPGLVSWTIFLDADNSGTLNGGETQTNTDANGNYTFSGIGPGTYRVREVQQAGWTQTTSDPAVIAASSGTNVSNVDFGNFQLISISGQKFRDNNGDGIKNGADAGLQGWTIFIDADNSGMLDGGEVSTTTDTNGDYSFPNLGPGTYRIREVQQAGWTQTTSNPALITASSGTNAIDVNFGNFQLVMISGQKFNDLDGDGIKNGDDSGLEGWTIFIDTDNSGTLNGGEVSTTTDTNGDYSFTNLGPGTYRMRELQQTGWTRTTANPALIATSSGTNVGGVDFGNFQLVTISGQKYNDRFGNGVNGEEDAGLPNWVIFIDADNSGTLNGAEVWTTTDTNGNYSFPNLGPGTYVIREVPQAGWTQTSINPEPITVSSGTDVFNVDFGNFKLITISGQKFNDLNGNGELDQGELGLSGWTIYIDADLSGTLTAGDPQTVTGTNGAYSFSNLGPGAYELLEVPQAGWMQTTSNPSPVFATSGDDVTGVDFGNFQLITISGQKFHDHNGDGIRNGADAGLVNWTIFIDTDDSGTLNGVEISTTTDANGNYSFTGLAPGSYQIREVQQTGWTKTTSDPALIFASSGTNVANIDFGNFQLITISGQKFNDLNGDGSQQGGELGLQGWTIFIDADDSGTLNGVEASTTTDMNGNYSFSNLGPGTYRIREVGQTGWVQTSGNPALITASSGSNVSSVNFGNFQLITISGQKFDDLNGNGSQQGGELGLQGWTIFIDADNSGGLNGSEVSTTTDVNGNYSFTNLGPGTYSIREVAQNGWIQTTVNPTPITAASGSNVPGVNFGNFHRITISGQKYNDLNGNGTQQGGELGLQGWTIFIDADNSGGLNGSEVSTTTDVNGNYSFPNLGPGTYQVREVAQSGWIQTSTTPSPIVASSGSNVTSVNFGNFQLITISGQKFDDLNGNGSQQGGELGLQGWTIFIDSDNSGTVNGVEVSTTTDVNGNYSFANLGPGTYRIREVFQTGWTQTSANPALITASSGMNVSGVNFGNFQQITISGQKFNDLNGDGAQQGAELGLQGWTIFIDTDNSGTLNGSEVSTTTDMNGNYSFTNLGPGDYIIREVGQAGWTQTTANPALIAAVSGSNVSNVIFGNFQLITISGQKFNDLNGNGSQQGGELGLQGWTIFIDADNSGTLNGSEVSTTTDANGNYSFTNLGPGTYRIREVGQTGWVQTSANPALITASSGSNVSSVNFGNFQLITISGQKFDDLNGDGSQQGGELGLQGWTIFIDTDNSGGLNGSEVSTTTDVNGNYSFANLGPGSYSIREVAQAGWIQTTVNPTPITAASGSNVPNVNFGNFHRITISGQKYNDVNGNGTQQGGELGLQGWTMFLDLDSSGSLSTGDVSTTTDVNGNYSFPNLGPGTYQVREVAQSGWIQTSTTPSPIVASSGSNVPAVNFGNFQLITISGQKFNDLNGNGSQQGGEVGLQGWTIFIDSDNSGTLNGVEVSTTTDVNGNYSFSNLGPGTYRIREVGQTGWVQTSAPPALITTSSGTNVSSVNFGNFQLISISGQKFRDNNSDGIKNGADAGLQGWTIFIDADNSGTLTGGETFTTTDVNGNYSFANLGPNTYIIREVQQAGWTRTTLNPGPIVASSGLNVTNVNFGNFPVPAIQGRKFNDLDGSTNDNLGADPGLGGWTIQLYSDVNNNNVYEPNIYLGGVLIVAGADGDPVATTTTTAPNGAYNLGALGIPSGRYFVAELQQQGWRQTAPTTVHTVNYVTNTPVANVNFGNNSCTDRFSVGNGATTVTAPNRGLLTLELLGTGTFTVTKVGGGSFSVYNGAGGASSVTSTTSRASEYAPRETGRQRIDVLANAGDQFNVTVSGSSGNSQLRVVNAVNVDTASTLALQITGTSCGETVVVRDDANFGAVSDAKRIYIGATTGTFDGGANLAFDGVEYAAPLMNAMFGNPTISRVDINVLGGDDIVRIGNEITQQSTLLGGDGNDLLRAGGGKSTVTAGNGHDFVVGGPADDTIYGGAGNDYLYGLGGADLIFGDDGDDYIAGGDGDDPLLRGGNGNDFISGGAGKDRLLGDAGGGNVAYRDASDLQVTGFASVNVVPPDAVQSKLDDMIDRIWQDHYLANGNDDASLDTLDELFDSLLP